MTTATAYALASTAILAILIGQLLFKRVANLIAGKPLQQALQNPEVIGNLAVAVLIYGAATVIWVLALRHLALSRAYMLMAAGFIFIPICSHFFFSEPLSKQFFLGASLIAIGIVLTNS